MPTDVNGVRPLVPSAISRVSEVPKPKASTGITYQHVCELAEASIDGNIKPSLGTNVVYNSQLKRVKALMDALYGAVRLEAWTNTTVNTPAVQAFSLPVSTVSIVVTDFTVELWKGMRRFPIADKLEASALFKALEQAQAIITPLGCNLEIPDEEFFTPPDPGQAVDDILRESDEEAEGVQAHFNKMASAEAEEVSEKYDPAKAPKKAAPDDSMVMAALGRGSASRLKSLQGRVLGIMDAAFADKDQRQAVKTLINKEFRRDLDRLNDADSDGE